MFYYLAQLLIPYVDAFNVLTYHTVRAGGAGSAARASLANVACQIKGGLYKRSLMLVVARAPVKLRTQRRSGCQRTRATRMGERGRAPWPIIR